MAQTQLSPEMSDHVDLDSGRSGSGLLDLSREADDTSLGAELLDEIYPGPCIPLEFQSPIQDFLTDPYDSLLVQGEGVIIEYDEVRLEA